MKQSKPKLEYRNRGQVYLGVVDLDKLIEAGCRGNVRSSYMGKVESSC